MPGRVGLAARRVDDREVVLLRLKLEEPKVNRDSSFSFLL